MKLYSAQTINEIKDRHNFNLSKSLGQNFLTDKNIIDEIIESSGISSNDLVIEIGPGIGVLTKEALEAAGRVIAIEIDQRLIPILEETLSEYDNFEVINADILKTDLKAIIEANKGYDAVRIIGNLPYYITTPIIMKILEDGVPADSITIMMQKEVADRIKAPVGSKNAGAITAAVQFYCNVTQIASVPKEVFIPRPKIDSAVLRLDVLSSPAVDVKDRSLFFECIKKGFGQRRKTILNSLNGVGGIGKEELAEAFEINDIDPQRRAETLSLAEFGKIADTISGGQTK